MKIREFASTAAGSAALVVSGLVASRGVSAREREMFERFNSLPDVIYLPMAGVMQAGSYPAVWVTAYLMRKRVSPMVVAATGTGVWLACKGVKFAVRRGRPEAEIDDVKVRGGRQSGLGFPSGHAAVSFALASVVSPELPARLRWLPWGVAATVATARVYVGAHLPADIAGGIGAGIVAGSVARIVRNSSGSDGPERHGIVSEAGIQASSQP